MGNSALRDISVINEIEIDSLEGETAAIDAYNWLYKYITTTVQFTNEEEYTTSDGVEVPNLHGGARGIRRFFENDIHPVFVFDGDSHTMKEAELSDRRKARQSAKEEAEEERSKGNQIEAAKKEARSKRMTDEMVHSTIELLEALDIPYVIAPQSGESQAAYMAAEGDYDFVVSDDYDSILFGSPQTIRNFTSSSRPFEELRLDETLDESELSEEQLIDVAILCGTDYNDGVSGYGPKTSVKAIKEHGGLETLMEEKDFTVDQYEEIREIFLTPRVVEDYPQPRKPNPDIEKTRELLLEKWELPEDVVESAIDKIEEAANQSGLDKWT